MLQHIPVFRGLGTRLAFCLGLIVAVASARADLVEIDWKTPGDKMIVKDNATGLEFLKLSASWRLSVNQVTAQLGPGGQYAGFRYATFAEVNTMLTNGGLPTMPDYHSGFAQTTISLADLNRFIALFGYEEWGYGPQSYGYVADTYFDGYETRVVTAIYSHDTAYGMDPRTAVGSYPFDFGGQGIGSYLVRQGSMADQVAKLQQQIADLQKQLAQDDDLIKSLQDQLTTAKQTIDALTADKAALSKQLQLAQTQLAQAEAKTAATQAALADAQAANATLSDQLAAANANTALLTKQNALLAKNLDDAQAKLAATQNLLATTQGQLATTQATLAQRDAAIAAANATIAGLQAQLAQQQATVTSLSSSLGTAVGDSSFTIPGATLEQQVSNLSTAISNLNAGQKKALYKNLGGVK